ncbi:hypothetical protein ACFSJ3_04390 [Corallincola platygyrae]|uniref:STAS/SEC14 domain-containing protein n=1 Tax=Corallincola platygyrae TaxID=1193278 RepID=A0ABW4XKQ1_9GAMM
MKAHGEITIEWRGARLVVKAFGAFNPEGVIVAGTIINEEINSAPFARFTRFEQLSDETMSSADGFAHVKQNYLNSFKCGCAAIAVVSERHSGMLSHMFAELCMRDDFQVFSSVTSAEQWLSEFEESES